MKPSCLASLLVVCLSVCLLPACGARRTPDLARIFEGARVREGKRPVIVVPGILGSELINSETGEVVWVNAARTKNDGLSLPTSPDLDANQDGLVPRDIVRRARFAAVVPEVYVYQELVDALEKFAGYREVKWDEATPNDTSDTFFVFPYDWRQDNVRSAQRLIRRIEELKVRMNRPDLQFNIVAHSMGGLVARYAAMYGAADLPDGDMPPRVSWAGARHINSIFMFGTPNEGSMEAFATLLGGYSITEGLRRRVPLLYKLSREDAFTIPSIYQILPFGETSIFLDAELKPLALDLYDPSVWRRYSWSGTAQEESDATDAYLTAVLRRARAFQRALNAESDVPAPVRLFAFGGDCEETLAHPILASDEKTERWLTFTESRNVPARVRGKRKRAEIIKLMYEPGDGRVTRRSLIGEDLRAADATSNMSLPINYAVFACDLHGDVQKNKTLQDNALTVLIREAIK